MPMSVITVAGINPILNILGATQQFNYTQPLSLLQVNNSFIPTALISSQFNMEYRNNLLSGFRWTHLTKNNETHGSLTLQSFVNAESSGIDLMTFTENGDIAINTSKAALYMISNATGTTVLANTFTKILGTTTSSFSNNFTNTDNKSTYNGSTTINTTVTANISVSHPILVGGATLGVSIYKNGITQLSAGNYEFQPTENAITSLSISGVYAQFTIGDFVEVFVSSTIATDLTVRDMNLSIST